MGLPVLILGESGSGKSYSIKNLDAEKVGEPGVLRMSPEIVKAACTRAHELGFKVAAHVESPEGVKVALENGVDSIEHGAKPTEEIMKLFKERLRIHTNYRIQTIL